MKHGLNHIVCMMCGRDPPRAMPKGYPAQMPMTSFAQCFLAEHHFFGPLR
jgi:hypothetical protein